MKRFLTILCIMVFLCVSAPFSYAQNRFTIPEASENEEDYATREQAIAQFVKALGIDKFDIDVSVLDKFSDKTKISYSYMDEMSAAVYSGLIGGYEDRTLRPQGNISRIEGLVILARALSRTELPNVYDAEFSDIPAWAEKDISRLISAGIVKGYGDGTLGSADRLTVSQVQLLCERIVRVAGAAGDFYNYVNSAWLSSTDLDGALEKSEFIRMSETVDNNLKDIIYSLCRRYYGNGESFAENSNEKKIINVYAAATNQSYRDKIGLSPIQEILDGINTIKNTKALMTYAAKIEKQGLGTFLPLVLEMNIYDADKHVIAVAEPYKVAEADEEYYKGYLTRLFEISGEDKPFEMAEYAYDIAVQLSKEKNDSGYLYKMTDLRKQLKNIDLSKYLSDCGYPYSSEISVYNIENLKTADRLINSDNLDKLKAYMKASVLDYMAPYLTTETFNAWRSYQNDISGIITNLIPSDLSTDIVESMLGFELGAIYVEEYFLERSKQSVLELTRDIIKEYEKLLKNCERMTPKTRENAIKKLENMKINVAYPDNLKTYKNNDFVIRSVEDGGSLPEYIIKYNEYYHNRCQKAMKSGGKVENNGWSSYPQTVNASYNPLSNCIVIPAGILQAPFFEESAGYEENLGGIGVVIAHEISHAFDSIGARFDEKGNLNNWWSEKDYEAFNVLCNKIKDEYSSVRVDAGDLDGELTLNENLADIAAMSCVLRLADSNKLDELFESYAKCWRTKRQDFYAEMMLENDEHSPAKVRVNRVLSNFEEFIDFYGVEVGDGMYLPERNRIDIWK